MNGPLFSYAALALSFAASLWPPDAVRAAEPSLPPAPFIDLAKAPAPLFDDPVWHGAADPTVLWNPERRQYLMYYTQRRGTLIPAHNVDWMHGSALGVASSPDGLAWKYEGICHGDHDLDDPVQAGVSWWAPSVYRTDDGTYHLFAVCVDGGIHADFGGGATIPHFTSQDGLNWSYESTPKLSSGRCIDACVEKINDDYYLWYKDEGHGSHIWAAKSKDLRDWTVVGEAIGDVAQEAPLVFRWQGLYWMMTDPHEGLGIYSSAGGTDQWVPHHRVLAKGGRRPKDDGMASHPCVLPQGDRAVVFYHVQSNHDPVYDWRLSYIQAAELRREAGGAIICDRDQFAPKP